MDLILYTQSGTPKRVDKSGFLSIIATIGNVIIKDTTELFSPTFILRTTENVYTANYLYCSFTGRYYFIERFDTLSGGRIAVKCRTDVLHTFRNEILSSKAWVTESADTADTSDDYNMLHNDFPFRADYEIKGCWLTDYVSPFITFGQGNHNIFMVIK